MGQYSYNQNEYDDVTDLLSHGISSEQFSLASLTGVLSPFDVWAFSLLPEIPSIIFFFDHVMLFKFLFDIR